MRLSSLQFAFGVSVVAHGLAFSFAYVVEVGQSKMVSVPRLGAPPGLVLKIVLEPENVEPAPQATAIGSVEIEGQSIAARCPEPADPGVSTPPSVPLTSSEIEDSSLDDFLRLPVEDVQTEVSPRQTVAVVDDVELPSLDEDTSFLGGDLETRSAAPTDPTYQGSTPLTGNGNPGAMSVEGMGRNPAAYLLTPKPTYPKEAQRRREQGIVIVAATVSSAGHPVCVSLRQSSKSTSLDHAALEAVRHWRFRPAKVRGVAVPSEIEVPVHFQLSQ
jgi:TonB family protein